MQSNGTRTPSKRRCRTCRTSTPAGALVQGECALCAGLQPLPLRGDRGRFLTFVPPVLADPDPDLCCGVPARITEDDKGRTVGHCAECGSLLFRQLPDDTTPGIPNGGAR